MLTRRQRQAEEEEEDKGKGGKRPRIAKDFDQDIHPLNFDHHFKRALYHALPRRLQPMIQVWVFLYNLVIPWDENGQVDWSVAKTIHAAKSRLPQGAWNTLGIIIALENASQLMKWVLMDIMIVAGMELGHLIKTHRWKTYFRKMDVKYHLTLKPLIDLTSWDGHVRYQCFDQISRPTFVHGMQVSAYGENGIVGYAQLTMRDSSVYRASVHEQGKWSYVDPVFNRVTPKVSPLPASFSTTDMVEAYIPDAVHENRRMAFMLGLHKRVGAASSLHRAKESWLFERHLMPLIMSFVIAK
jgi:hypothetical protein